MPSNSSQWLKETPYAHDLGIQILTVGAEACRLILPFAQDNTVGGAIHGGVLASMAVLCSQSIMRETARSEAESPSVVSLQVAYLRSARTQSVWVETRAMRRARELGFFETKLLDHDGKLAAQAFAVAGETRGPAASTGPSAPLGGDVGALQSLAASIPFLARRQIRVIGVGPGQAELAVPPIEVNLARDQALHEGVAIALIDAAGATAPWTAEPPKPDSTGVTVALQAEILARLPHQELVARASLRARDRQLCWSDVEVFGAEDRRLYAKGSVTYLIGSDLGTEIKAAATA